MVTKNNLDRIFFSFLLASIVLGLNVAPSFFQPDQNHTIFPWQDNSIYLGFVKYHDGLLTQNPYIDSSTEYLTIIPFFIINKLSFFGLEWAYLFWIVLFNILVVYFSLILAERIGIDEKLFAIGFLFLNNCLLFFTWGIQFFFPSGTFQWYGFEWLKGTNFVLNLWHPIFVFEIVLTLLLLLWLLDSRKNELAIGLVPLLVYFGRGYIAPLYLAFVFIAYYYKTKQINRAAIATGFIVLVHQIWSRGIPEYVEQISFYNIPYHYPVFWIVASTVLLLCLFADGFFKLKKNIGFYIATGIVLAILLNIFTPLNIRTTLNYTLFVNLGAALGFATLNSTWSKYFILLLSAFVLIASFTYTSNALFESDFSRTDSEMAVIGHVSDWDGLMLAPPNVAEFLVWKTNLSMVYSNGAYSNEMVRRGTLVKEFYVDKNNLAILETDPEFVWMNDDRNILGYHPILVYDSISIHRKNDI